MKVVLALGDYMNVQCHSCIGGTNLGEDIRKLDYGQHVVSGKWNLKNKIFEDFWQLSFCSPDLTTNSKTTYSEFSRIFNLWFIFCSYRLSKQFDTEWPPNCEKVCPDSEWKSATSHLDIWSLPFVIFKLFFPQYLFASSC